MIIIIIAKLSKIDMDWLSQIAHSDIFTLLCGITTLLSFGFTIIITIRTKSIDNKLKHYKLSKLFNKDRKKLLISLHNYQKSINTDMLDVGIIKGSILNDLNYINEKFCPILSYRQNRTIKKFISVLEREKQYNKNIILNLLSKVISFMSIERED